MGVDTIVFVVADQSKILDAVGNVNKHLDVFIRSRLDEFAKEKGYNNRFHAISDCKEDHSVSYSNGVGNTYVNFFGDSASFQISFGCGDNNNRLLHCSQNECDYKEIIEGNKIIFSWGCWGSNKEIAQIVCEALYKFGPVYYDLNDCDEVDFQLFDGEVK